MNILTIFPRFVDSVEVHEGIPFSSCVFIEIRVDGLLLTDGVDFDGAIYFPELLRSVDGSGGYLTFTCYCGIADDSDWQLVIVEHREDSVFWRFKRGREYKFQFMREAYVKEVHACQEAITISKYPLAISTAVWPE